MTIFPFFALSASTATAPGTFLSLRQAEGEWPSPTPLTPRDFADYHSQGWGNSGLFGAKDRYSVSLGNLRLARYLS